MASSVPAEGGTSAPRRWAPRALTPRPTLHGRPVGRLPCTPPGTEHAACSYGARSSKAGGAVTAWAQRFPRWEPTGPGSPMHGTASYRRHQAAQTPPFTSTTAEQRGPVCRAADGGQPACSSADPRLEESPGGLLRRFSPTAPLRGPLPTLRSGRQGRERPLLTGQAPLIGLELWHRRSLPGRQTLSRSIESAGLASWSVPSAAHRSAPDAPTGRGVPLCGLATSPRLVVCTLE